MAVSKVKAKKVTRKRVKKAGESEIERALRLVIETGEYEMGFRTAQKDSLLAKAKAIVIAKNAPPEKAQDIKRYCELSQLPCITVDKTSLELGSLCGRPHPVAFLIIYNPGESNILELAKEG